MIDHNVCLEAKMYTPVHPRYTIYAISQTFTYILMMFSDRSEGKRKFLKRSAVPSVFPWSQPPTLETGEEYGLLTAAAAADTDSLQKTQTDLLSDHTRSATHSTTHSATRYVLNTDTDSLLGSQTTHTVLHRILYTMLHTALYTVLQCTYCTLILTIYRGHRMI